MDPITEHRAASTRPQKRSLAQPVRLQDGESFEDLEKRTGLRLSPEHRELLRGLDEVH